MTTAMKQALTTAGLDEQYILTAHAIERVRQRAGIESLEVATEWVTSNIRKASRSFNNGNKTHYLTDAIEIITDGLKVVTVKPTNKERDYLDILGEVVMKEVDKMIEDKERDLRKVEIKIAEHTLNRLKARNPNTVALIGRRLVRAIDEKQRIQDELWAIKKAGGQYGVDAK